MQLMLGRWEILVWILVIAWIVFRVWTIMQRSRPRRVCGHRGCDQTLPAGARFCPRCGHRATGPAAGEEEQA